MGDQPSALDADAACTYVSRTTLDFAQGQRRATANGGFLARVLGQKASVLGRDASCKARLMTERVYLDWNATSPLRRETRGAVLAAMDVVGNPSSVHAEGRAARRLVEEARENVAALVGAEPRNVTFTSGGTEANAMALSPSWTAAAGGQPRDCLVVSAIEHPSVLAGGRFARDAI